MVLGKKVAIFDWEWGGNSAPRDGQKRPWYFTEKHYDESVHVNKGMRFASGTIESTSLIL